MQALDAHTLLLVNAVFNGFAALAWALLAGLFRIAPRASWLMAAAHLTRILSLRCDECLPGWGTTGVFELAALATLSLLALAVRRMLRLRQHWLDIALITGGCALFIVWPGLPVFPGQTHVPFIAASFGMCLLALLACRDVVSGAGPGLAGWLTTLMALPHGLLGLVAGARLFGLLAAPQWEPLFREHGHASALMAAVWLCLSAAISLSLAALLIRRLVSRIEHLTRRDAMTGTLNRRALDAELLTLQSLRERGHGYAIVLVDIDHFKRINDEFGHAAGDAALQHCVAVLRGCMRELDLLGRQGGEEFCALLPHTSLAAAAQVAERMRAALQAQPLDWRDRSLSISGSFGVVSGQLGDALGAAAIARADQLVYRAKAAGRNRVCVADEDAT